MGQPVYLVNGKRTPFGKFGGSLSTFSTLDLCVHAASALFAESKISPDSIDQVIVSNVIPPTAATLYCARHLALKLGMPVETPAYIVNRLCGSGIEAIVQAQRLIQMGEAQAILVAGVENMSMIPHLLYGARFGTKYGNPKTADFLLDTLTDQLSQIPMGETAEKLADEYKISREESDEFSLNSHKKAEAAWASGKFTSEVVSVKLAKSNLEKDEHLRADATIADLSKLKPSFRKEGVVTPGSASGIVDGAAVVLIASEAYIQKHGLSPLATLGDSAVVGVDPAKMGIGPYPAIEKLLKKTNKKLSEIDLIEINEAFSPQVIACAKALQYPMNQLNIWGGAIAMGHPLGATGVRIALTLARQLRDNKQKTGIASACIGGGQGIALCLS
ncbi:MAG: thiolase family protein [Bacteriovoracaceae bacterium]|nr:thiolase family protein [Bacteriovoracaceae bacterium]